MEEVASVTRGLERGGLERDMGLLAWELNLPKEAIITLSGMACIKFRIRLAAPGWIHQSITASYFSEPSQFISVALPSSLFDLNGGIDHTNDVFPI